MQSILILTDFSDAAFRAAEYGCNLTGLLQINRIVLFHAFQTIAVTTDMPVYPVKTEYEVYRESMEALGLLHDRLKPIVGKDVKIELLAVDAVLPEMINQQCREQNIDMIVMGVSGKSGLEKLLMGSTTARMLQTSEFPILIVPKEAKFGKEIKTIVF